MKRFWIRFEKAQGTKLPIGTKIGCGVTATNLDEACEIIKTQVFGNSAVPPILEAIEDVDISQLDERHVIPNMGNPLKPGIWFPLGYEKGS